MILTEELDKSANQKYYFGRQEVARLLHAILFLKSKRKNGQMRVQLALAILFPFFTAIRISTMKGSHDRGRTALEVLHPSLFLSSTSLITYIPAVDDLARYKDILSRLREVQGGSSSTKYQGPELDLGCC